MSKRRKSSPPRHYNPWPMFGLRVMRLSRTAQATYYMIGAAGLRGLTLDRLEALLYMADVQARMYLGHPITDLEWRNGAATEPDKPNASPSRGVIPTPFANSNEHGGPSSVDTRSRTR